jgi:peptidyl-prolyl cis-trans isomerase B (cyclophilin B)
VGKKERQRKLARERMLRQQARRANRARRSRQITMISVVCLVVVGLGVGGFFLFSQPGTTSNAAASASASPSSTAAATPTPSATPALAKEPAKTCSYPTSGTAARKVSKPPAKPDWRASYQATIHTNRGDVVIDLLNSKATCTVNSFVSLADQKYFSKTDCHRLTTVSPLYVLQCGDPTGTGSGGPGYKFNNENLTGAKYTAGTLAMANAGADTNGSQFFLVYKNSTLSPNYTPFGKVVKGLGIIQNVAKAGSDNANGTGDGHPKEKVEIESVTIKKT